MVAIVRTVDALEALIVDNTTGQDTPSMVRDLAESAFAIVLSPNGVKTANYTAVITDRGCVLPMNTASGTTAANATYTIPAFISVPFPLGAVLGLLWVNGAAIQPAFAAGSGTTVIPMPSLTPRAAGSIAWAWQYSQNVWYTFGDLT